MVELDRVEPETETHRTEKALRSLVHEATLPLARGAVEVRVSGREMNTPGGQHLLLLLVHLLARMKGIVHKVVVRGPVSAIRLPGVPLPEADLGTGLAALVEGLSGPKSRYRCELILGREGGPPDVRLGIGPQDGVDLSLGADAWRALTGTFVDEARWEDWCPLGAYMAATIGAAETFKRLLRLNFGVSEGTIVDDLALSLFDDGIDLGAGRGPDMDAVQLTGLAVAGAGAGGTACLYTLASFPKVQGVVIVVEPGRLKASSLGRYLLSDYQQVHAEVHKLESVEAFLKACAPELRLVPEPLKWHEVTREWERVVCTVDTPEARRDVQRSGARAILEAGVVGTIYTVLRIVPGGWCLECKHPPDPGVTWRRRALMWGLPVEELKHRFGDGTLVTRADLERLATVQGRPVDDFLTLEGRPFDEVPSLTECGETPLALAVPSQAPVLPLTTTAAGILLAAEVVKDMTGLGRPLSNHFAHDLRHRPRPGGHRFRPRRDGCAGCSAASAVEPSI